MADISGIVTDTGSTPIAGALVRLENGGQTAITGADGLFTLVVSAAILPGANHHPRMHNLSASIQNGVLWVHVAKQSAVDVTTCNLAGKALSTVQTATITGTTSIMLPFLGAGIYLYKVKSEYGEVVLKSISMSGVASRSATFSHNASAETLAKQSIATDSIANLITVAKTGYLHFRMNVYNADTTGIKVKMVASAGTITDVDGNEYQTVTIGNQVWMVENLRTTTYNDGSAIPLETDSAAWSRMYDSSLTTAAYCFYNNTTNADSIRKFGALYNWFVVDTKKLSPVGWHVPDSTEWFTLATFLGGVNVAAGNLKTTGTSDWATPNIGATNKAGFSALPGGYRSRTGAFVHIGNDGNWWSSTEKDAATTRFWVMNFDSDYLYRFGQSAGYGFSVRCVRD